MSLLAPILRPILAPVIGKVLGGNGEPIPNGQSFTWRNANFSWSGETELDMSVNAYVASDYVDNYFE